MFKFCYCKVCQRNLTTKEFKKHHYNPWHKKRLLEILEEEKSKFQPFFSEKVQPSDLTFDPLNFQCWFCDFRPKLPQEDPKASSPDIVAVWKHLASKTHKENLKQFWNDMRLDWKLQEKYRMDKGLLNRKIQEFEALKNNISLTNENFISNNEQDTNTNNDNMNFTNNSKNSEWSSVVTCSLSSISPSNILSSTSTQTALSLDIPDVVKEVSQSTKLNPQSETTSTMKVKEPKTLISKNGILQNPTGFHNGERVWGGGIIKVKPEEWIPWPIDLDDENDEYEEGKSYLGEYPTISSHHRTKNDMNSSTEQNEQPFKRTIGYAPNLTRIEVQPLPDGNIHTGAKPPWLRDENDLTTTTSSSSSSTSSTFGPSIIDLSILNRSKKREKNPNRVGADWVRYVQQQQHEKNEEMWLPKFGRVWNEGPRTASRREFLMEQKMEQQARTNYQRAAQNLSQRK